MSDELEKSPDVIPIHGGCFFYGSSSFAFEAVKLAKIAPKLFAAEKKNVKATPVRPDER